MSNTNSSLSKLNIRVIIMEYYINSNQISPFVRYAGFHRHGTIHSGSPVCAADCRLFYFVNGGAVMKYADQSVRTKSGDLLILPPAIPYAIPDTELYIINFDFLATDFTLDKAIPVQKSLEAVPHQRVHLADFPQLDEGLYTNIPSIKHIFDNLSSIYKNKEIYFRTEMNSLFTGLLTLIFKNIIGTNADNSIDKIIEYVNSSCHLNLSNSFIGEKFHYHPNYLNKLFIKHTGYPLHKYVVTRRIEKAQLLLSTTSLSATEIAFECGFKNLSQFSKTFKEYTGVSPTNFRIT